MVDDEEDKEEKIGAEMTIIPLVGNKSRVPGQPVVEDGPRLLVSRNY